MWGLDEDLIGFLPQPIIGLLFCFPITEESEQFRRDEDKKREGEAVDPAVYHIKQTIGNACGTIGLIHTVMNNRDSFQLTEGKFWSNFYNETTNMDNKARAEALNENEDIEEEHQAVASSGSSNADHAFNDNLHFIVFTAVNGNLYELDGRKNFPVNHGPTTDVLRDGIKQIRRFMAFAPNDHRYNTVALSAAN
jgi:ubiquitin carboxyl-terminal hydrolase L3